MAYGLKACSCHPLRVLANSFMFQEALLSFWWTSLKRLIVRFILFQQRKAILFHNVHSWTKSAMALLCLRFFLVICFFALILFRHSTCKWFFWLLFLGRVVECVCFLFVCLFVFLRGGFGSFFSFFFFKPKRPSKGGSQLVASLIHPTIPGLPLSTLECTKINLSGCSKERI